MSLLIAFALLFQAPTDKEAEESLKVLKEELAQRGIEGRISAIKEALKTSHEKVIHAMAAPLGKDVEPVRIATAQALADVDHPASAEVLVEAIPGNLSRPEVMNAISAALGDLGWQSAAGPLNTLVKRVAEVDVRAILPGVVHALGEIGSASSVDFLIDFLIQVQGPRRNAWPNEGAIVRAAETALHAITGAEHKRGLDWQEWWKAQQANLLSKAKRVYWIRKTQERTLVTVGEKAPEDSVLVMSRIADPPVSAKEPKKKKKKS